MVPRETPFVALADQDDYWHPEKLDVLRTSIGDATIVYCDARVVDEDGTLLSDTYWSQRRNNSSNFASLLLANCVSGGAALYRRDLLDLALPFPHAEQGFFHDHWLAVAALAVGRIAYVDRPLYDYVQHGEAVLGHEHAPARAGRAGGSASGCGTSATDREYLYEHWRTAYFQEYCRVSLIARLLLARREHRIPPSRRRQLRRFVDSERSPRAIAWLAPRARLGSWRDETRLSAPRAGYCEPSSGAGCSRRSQGARRPHGGGFLSGATSLATESARSSHDRPPLQLRNTGRARPMSLELGAKAAPCGRRVA